MNTPTLGLYIHIPFCKQKCVYCDFYSLAGNESRMEEYTAALCDHLAALSSRAAEHIVDTVYFGGGTPSYLGPERLCRILQAIQRHYRVSPDAEITFEANPDSACDVSALAALRQAGKRVPEDYAVAGFDNLLLGKMVQPELTSVDQMAGHAGCLALDILIRRLQETDPGELTVQMQYQPHLIARESTIFDRSEQN